MGAPGSGKSTFVETLLHALARRYTPDALNIYALDCTSRRTAAFAACPQVGAVLDATDLSRVGRLFALLDGLLTERQTRLQGGNYAQYVAAHDVRGCPAVLLVVEDIAAFRERTACAYDDALLRLAREGAACGIYLFVTGSGFGMQDIPARWPMPCAPCWCWNCQTAPAMARPCAAVCPRACPPRRPPAAA